MPLWFPSLADASARTEDWTCHYKEHRPNTAVSGVTREPAPTELSQPENLPRFPITN